MKKYNLNLLSKNRATVYGISILWIMLFHSTFVFENKWLLPVKLIQSCGGFGVDIFIFLSGISLYFAMEDEPSVIKFYANRLKRIVPSYVLVTVPFYYLVDVKERGLGLAGVLADIFGITFFTNGNRIFWFATAILIMYLLYPLIYRLLKGFKNNFAVPAVLITVVFILNYLFAENWPEAWSRCNILMRRFPDFIIGAYLGKYVYEEKELPFGILPVAAVSVLGVAFASMCTSGINSLPVPTEYFYFIFGLPTAMLLAKIGELKIFSKPLSVIAPATFEIYLLQEKVTGFLSNYIELSRPVMLNTLSFAATVFIAVIMRKLEVLIFRDKK